MIKVGFIPGGRDFNWATHVINKMRDIEVVYRTQSITFGGVVPRGYHIFLIYSNFNER